MNYLGPFCLVVPDSAKQSANDTFAVLDPDSGGGGTFSVPLSGSGEPPATHWGARTMLEAATHSALTEMDAAAFQAYVYEVADARGRRDADATDFKETVQLSAAGSGFNEFIFMLRLARITVEEPEEEEAP